MPRRHPPSRCARGGRPARASRRRATVSRRPSRRATAAGFNRATRTGVPPISTSPPSTTRVCRLSRTTAPSGGKLHATVTASVCPYRTAVEPLPGGLGDRGEQFRVPRRESPARGSPSTPFAETARTPPERSAGSNSASGSVAPTSARSSRTLSGAQVRHQRGLRRVPRGRRRRLLPARHTAATRHPDLRTAAARRRRRAAPRLPPWPFTKTTRGVHSRRRATELDEHVLECRRPDRDRSGERLVLAARSVRHAPGRRRHPLPAPATVRRERRRPRSRRRCRCRAAGAARAARSIRPGRASAGTRPPSARFGRRGRADEAISGAQVDCRGGRRVRARSPAGIQKSSGLSSSIDERPSPSTAESSPLRMMSSTFSTPA